MMYLMDDNPFLATITSTDPSIRNRSVTEIADALDYQRLDLSVKDLEQFRRSSDNLYDRVRASMFLAHLYRFYLMEADETPRDGLIPYPAYENFLDRRFEEALKILLDTVKKDGPNGALFSTISQCYHELTFETLTDQVRKSVRASRGNQWMFRNGRVTDHPIHVIQTLKTRDNKTGLFPILYEKTPVRLDLTHSGW